MGVREQFTSVAAYSLVALASAMVVSGGTVREAIRAAAHTPARTATADTAVAGARVSAAAPGMRVAAAAVSAPSPRQVAAEILPAPLPDIPGAGGVTTGAPTVTPAVPRRAAARSTPAPGVTAISETGSASLDATLRLARWLTQQWYDMSLDAVWASFSPSVKAQWKSYQNFRDFRAGGKRAYGTETAVLAEELTPHGDVTYYTRTAAFERGPKDGWTLILGLDAAGQVQDFGVVGASLLPARMDTLLR